MEDNRYRVTCKECSLSVKKLKLQDIPVKKCIACGSEKLKFHFGTNRSIKEAVEAVHNSTFYMTEEDALEFFMTEGGSKEDSYGFIEDCFIGENDLNNEDREFIIRYIYGEV